MMDDVKFEVSNRMELKERKADHRGRVAIGPEYAGKKVTIFIVNVEEISKG